MATKRLSTEATFVKKGYGQVEPNHLSAQRTAQIYAQLPSALDVLENGQFVKYDYANGEVNTTCATGEWMLVYNEVKVYEDHAQDCDFAMLKENYAGKYYNAYGAELKDNAMVPRVFKTNVGDIFTTNTLKLELDPATGDVKESEILKLKDNALLAPGSDGYLTIVEEINEKMTWQVVTYYTLADGQRAVKIMRIA